MRREWMAALKLQYPPKPEKQLVKEPSEANPTPKLFLEYRQRKLESSVHKKLFFMIFPF